MTAEAMNAAEQPVDLVVDEGIEGRELPALGAHDGLTFEQYKAAPGINKSGLDNIAIAPAYYLWHKNHAQFDTQAFAVGHAFHTLILEPHRFEELYVPAPFKEFRTNEAKAWRDEQVAAGKTVLRTYSADPERSPSEWDLVHRMADALRQNEIAMTLLADIRPELSIFWMDKGTGRLCKGRIDAYSEAHSLIIDIKTTKDATFSGFARAVHDHRYDVQDAFYTDGALAAGLKVQGFVFIAIMKEPPFLNACYTLPPDWRRMGRQRYRMDLDIYDQCKRTGEWPGLPPLRDLELPAYAKYNKIT